MNGVTKWYFNARSVTGLRRVCHIQQRLPDQVFPKLRGDKYFLWSASMELILRSLSQWEVVIGTFQPPGRVDAENPTEKELSSKKLGSVGNNAHIQRRSTNRGSAKGFDKGQSGPEKCLANPPPYGVRKPFSQHQSSVASGNHSYPI